MRTARNGDVTDKQRGAVPHPTTLLWLATAGLGISSIPRAADAEIRSISRGGKRAIAEAWIKFEKQIREAAAARHIRPPFPKARFFAEAIAADVQYQDGRR